MQAILYGDMSCYLMVFCHEISVNCLLYFSENIPEGCPENIFKSVCMSVLSALSGDPDVVRFKSGLHAKWRVFYTWLYDFYMT